MSAAVDKIPSPLPERTVCNFWRRVDKAGDGDCWNWVGYRNSYGYGAMTICGKSCRTHRVSFVLHSGQQIPLGMGVCHRCDNTSCVNPAHLFLGAPKDNVADMISKGRKAMVWPRGEQHGHSTLTVEQVRWVKSSGLSQSAMAAQLGVTRTAVHKIISGKNWRHVD